MKKLLAYIVAVFLVGILASIFFLYSFAHAQVSGSLWKLNSNQLLPINSAWGITVPSLANLNCIGTNGSGVFGTGTCSGGGGTFPFTVTSYGVSTSTVVGFTGGFMSMASTTFSQLATGAVYDQNGLILAHATTSASTISQDVWRDGNANIFANNFIPNVTSTAASGGTTVMTPASSRYQILTGNNSQTYQLPNANASGMQVGSNFRFNNNTTQGVGNILTVTDHGGNIIALVYSGGFADVYETNSGSANGAWDTHPYGSHIDVFASQRAGLGTTTPYARLSIQLNNGDIRTTAFAIGSSTALSTTTLFSISNTGTVVTSLGTGLVKSTSGTLGLAVSGTDYTLITGTTCGANQHVSAITALGSITCSSDTVTSVSNSDSTLTISPTTGAVVASLNLSHANIWAALQQFGSAASSTAFSVYNNFYAGATATTTIDNAGNTTIAGWLKIPFAANPTVDSSGKLAIDTTAASTSLHYFDGSAERALFNETSVSFSYGTSTPSGTTTIPFAGAIRKFTFTQIGCTSVGGTVNVQVGSGSASSTMVSSGTSLTTSYTTLSSNNTFGQGQAYFISLGGWSVNTVQSVTCSFGRTYDPN